MERPPTVIDRYNAFAESAIAVIWLELDAIGCDRDKSG
jgi:hypothetical protein